MRQPISLATAWVTLAVASVATAAPPVEVEVIVGDNENEKEDALFSKTQPSEESDSVQAAPKVETDGDANVNTQVLNVTINNEPAAESDVATSERNAEIESLEQDMDNARERLDAMKSAPAETRSEPVDQSAKDEFDEEFDRKWKKKVRKKVRRNSDGVGFEKGDKLIYGRFGDLNGFGFEYMVADRVSLATSMGWLSSAKDPSDRRSPSDRLLPEVALDRERGFLWEGAVHVHAINSEHWNVYGSVGLTNVRYNLDGEEEFDGGSIYGKLGGGVRFSLGALHTGFDLGWYPYEVTRYSDDDASDFEELRDSERTDSNRFLGTWLVGVTF
ncbi:MAG: hypothetical protein AAF654_06975 [Myxococcota bacterium]